MKEWSAVDLLKYKTPFLSPNENNTQQYNRRFTAIIQVNLPWPAPPVKNWRILLAQSFTARMPLLTTASAFGLGRRRWSSPQQWYLICTVSVFFHFSLQPYLCCGPVSTVRQMSRCPSKRLNGLSWFFKAFFDISNSYTRYTYCY